MDNLNSDWDNSTPDSSPPTGVCLDSQTRAMDITAGVGYSPSDSSTPPSHVFSPPSPRHSLNVRVSATPLCSQPAADNEVYATSTGVAIQVPPQVVLPFSHARGLSRGAGTTCHKQLHQAPAAPAESTWCPLQHPRENSSKTSSQPPYAGPMQGETSFTWPHLCSCQTDVSTTGVDHIKAGKGGIRLSADYKHCVRTPVGHFATFKCY